MFGNVVVVARNCWPRRDIVGSRDILLVEDVSCRGGDRRAIVEVS